MIEGHTDNIGKDNYNKDLSYRRATRVLSTLAEQYGIQASRLSAQGFGKDRPVASNASDLGRAQNRRVTIVNLGQ
jgi:OOP family OmpA-OmpF porin